MKWLTIIFAFYLLSLACMPCMCDDLQPMQETTSQHNHKKDNTKEDNCNPFCTCSCCVSIAFVAAANIQLPQAITFNIKKNTACNSQQFSSYTSHNIWQPPRV